MTICTYDARTLASETAVEHLMMQGKKIKYDVIVLIETRLRRSLNTVHETGEELFLGTCDNRSQELTSELARLYRETIKGDLNERRAEVLAAEAGKRIRYARRGFACCKTRMTADSHVHLPPHYLREDGHVIPKILPSEVRHAIMSVRSRTAPGSLDLSECKVNKQRKTSKTVLLCKKGDPDDIGSYRPICLLSVIYRLFIRVILKKSWMKDSYAASILTVSTLIEVSGEYKTLLTFIDLNKAFDSVEKEASNFTAGIPPFYNDVISNVKKGVRKGDTISPKIFTATLENTMQKLEWDDMVEKVDRRQLHHLRFADDIVLITPSIKETERMLTEFDETCGCISIQLNLQKTVLMRNGWVSNAPFMLNGTNTSECKSYFYLGRELNMMNDLPPS
ncbi:hypothetical protein RB195_013734 [Necator americanus]|uniref:Reverse transcriptase domain-containing protein n=2 Tax=Necator americanus TaxID=51031 RepID=A0ABR1DX00_NECAM